MLTLLNDGLDSLVHVVVNVLANDSGSLRARCGTCTHGLGVFELCRLSVKLLLNLGRIAVLKAALFDGGYLLLVHGGCDLTVLEGLNSGVVVVLVTLSLDGGLDLLMVLLDDGFVLNGRGGRPVQALIGLGGLLGGGFGGRRGLSAGVGGSAVCRGGLVRRSSSVGVRCRIGLAVRLRLAGVMQITPR